MPKVTMEEVGRDDKGRYVAVLKAETIHGVTRFYGFGSSVVEAIENALQEIRNARRPCRLGRRPRRYRIACALR